MLRRLAYVCLFVVLAGCASGLSERRARVLASAEALIGTPYRWGGTDRSGLDCSGLVQLSYAEAGLHVPRTTTALLRDGRPAADPSPATCCCSPRTNPASRRTSATTPVTAA